MTAEVTEYNVISDEIYEEVSFCLGEKCLVISFLDENDNVITQTEISLSDARKLAKLINL